MFFSHTHVASFDIRGFYGSFDKVSWGKLEVDVWEPQRGGNLVDVVRSKIALSDHSFSNWSASFKGFLMILLGLKSGSQSRFSHG